MNNKILKFIIFLLFLLIINLIIYININEIEYFLNPFHHTPTTSNHTPTTSNHTPTTSNHTPTTSNHTPTSSNHTPTSSNHTPTTSNHTPTTSNHTHTTSNHTPTTSNHTHTTSNHTPTTSNHTPTTSNHTPTTSNHTPTSSNHTPTSSNHTPTSSNHTPTSSDNTSKSNVKIKEHIPKYYTIPQFRYMDISKNKLSNIFLIQSALNTIKKKNLDKDVFLDKVYDYLKDPNTYKKVKDNEDGYKKFMDVKKGTLKKKMDYIIKNLIKQNEDSLKDKIKKKKDDIKTTSKNMIDDYKECAKKPENKGATKILDKQLCVINVLHNQSNLIANSYIDPKLEKAKQGKKYIELFDKNIKKFFEYVEKEEKSDSKEMEKNEMDENITVKDHIIESLLSNMSDTKEGLKLVSDTLKSGKYVNTSKKQTKILESLLARGVEELLKEIPGGNAVIPLAKYGVNKASKGMYAMWWFSKLISEVKHNKSCESGEGKEKCTIPYFIKEEFKLAGNDKDKIERILDMLETIAGSTYLKASLEERGPFSSKEVDEGSEINKLPKMKENIKSIGSYAITNIKNEISKKSESTPYLTQIFISICNNIKLWEKDTFDKIEKKMITLIKKLGKNFFTINKNIDSSGKSIKSGNFTQNQIYDLPEIIRILIVKNIKDLPYEFNLSLKNKITTLNQCLTELDKIKKK